MATLSIPNSFSPNTVIQSSQVNANFSAIATEYNAHAVQTDVAKTITVTHTFSASQTFSAGLSVGAAIIHTLAASQVIPGATSYSIRDTANANDNLLVSNAGVTTLRAGLVITAGGATITAGDLALTAGKITFGSATSQLVPGATSFSHRNNANNADNLLISDAGAVTVRNGLTVTAGGVAATGNSTVTGNLNVTGTITGVNGAPVMVRLPSDVTDTTGTPVNSALTVAVGVSQTWRLECDLGIACNNTGGVQLQFSVPTGATGHVFWDGATSSHTAFYSRSVNTFGAVQAWSTFNSAGDADGVMVRAVVIVTTDGTHSGNVLLQYSAVTPTQTATLRADSTMTAIRIS